MWEGPGALTLWDIASDGRVLLTLDEERKAVMARAPGEKTERDISLLDQSGLAAISRDGKFILGGDRFGMFLRGTNGLEWKEYPADAVATILPPMARPYWRPRKKATRWSSFGRVGTRNRSSLGGICSANGSYWFPTSSPPHPLHGSTRGRGETAVLRPGGSER